MEVKDKKNKNEKFNYLLVFFLGDFPKSRILKLSQEVELELFKQLIALGRMWYDAEDMFLQQESKHCMQQTEVFWQLAIVGFYDNPKRIRIV
eukprot:snap_masked-scaffold_22-processed-gene-2.21-mRNA-1 protein AED:1.00 eAED:1.00 QI:0/0/0/0/1/1/2/0/91